MKKKPSIYLSSLILLCCACGSGSNNQPKAEAEENDSVSINTDNTEEETSLADEAEQGNNIKTENTSDIFIMTAKAVGDLKVGIKPAEIPASIAGLYDKQQKKTETYYDMEEEVTDIYYKFLKGDKEIIRGTFYNGRIQSLTIYKDAGQLIQTEQGLYAGCELSKLFNVAKKLTWNYYFDGFILADDGKFVYRIADDYMKEDTESIVGQRALKLSDFKSGAVIHNISTKQ